MVSLRVSMSRKSKDSAPKSKELIFLLAIAGRIDAQSRLLAQKLDKNRYVYHAYAILDSLSSSYSMLKWFFEVCMPSNDPDVMHDILTSPEGIAAVSAEALFLVSFSFLASVYDGEEKNPVKKFIASAWPYFRDVMKGLKNAYKGWKSAVQVLGIISEADLKYMVVPVGLVLGVFAAVNRLWIRGMLESRKKKMNENKELLIEIQQLNSLTPLDREYYLSHIAHQDEEERIHAYLAVGAGGLLDGLYLYIGVVSLSVLAPPLFLAMSILSAVYALSCVITRIYEEYDFQLRLMVTQTKCQLALVTKEMELAYAKLLSLEEKKDKTLEDKLEIKRLKMEVCGLLKNFEELRQTLKDQTTHSYLTAGLLGMKYGLYAYGVLTSILFMVSSVFLVTATVFPPALLAAFIISGLVLMAGFTAYTLRAHYQHLKKQEKAQEEEHPYQQLVEMKKNIEADGEAAEILNSDSFGASVKDGLALDPSPQYFFQEWFEVFRSLASGISKGKSFSNFATTPLQEADSEGHYHDTPIMGILAAANAVLFSLVLGLRALARGLGRPPLGQVNSRNVKQPDVVESSRDDIKTKSSGESSEPSKKKASDSLPKNEPSIANIGFFSSKLKKTPHQDKPITHSKSETHFSSFESSSGGIILGLD
ncbi:transmembrane protein [Legionella cincinnatiensis]|uniref:Transmembrane protein n=2 Tax=Legionella cincinnatiensis TaxID=28085 RepID=A0A378INA2_9GAMM|nr:transmembrane protein [Legionella cincinnatiensis]STX36707.1 transmembrane protein [Legionella cincinnatiensis]